MLGIITELIISWLLLRYLDKSNLSVLGLKPIRERILNGLTGFSLAAVVCTLYHILSKIPAENSWIINKNFSEYNLLLSSWWVLKSVLFEELIFRGALLYLAIKKWGAAKACYLSAACFGVYHWFSFGAFGNPVQMVIVFFMTGLFGLMLAFAFAKTKSIYLPIALHLGWNFFNIVVFSNGPLGQQILIKANENKLEGIASLAVFLFQIFALPLLVFLYLKFIKSKYILQEKEAY